MNDATPVLECRNLSISYYVRAGEIPAVVDFNLRLMPGEAHGIVGESGCGKSTVALAVMNYMGKNGGITGGEILFEGRDMRTMSNEELRQIRGSKIAMVYQEPMASLNPAMRIGEQLAEVPLYHEAETSKEAAFDRAEQMLAKVRLPDPLRIMNAYPHQISGGQQQRVVIAMALLANPRLLLLDEPTTALDVTVQAQILALIKELQERLGMALLLITHDLGVVRAMADRVYVMEQGHVVEEGETADVFVRPAHPYTRKLIDAEPRGTCPIPEDEAQPLVETKDVTVEFPLRGWPRKRSLVAVDDVSLRVRQGHSLGVVGESGSGKTTLAMAIVRLLQSRGEIVFDGRSIDGLGFRQLKPLRRSMQIVFQDPYGSLSPRLTVEEIVSEGLVIHEPGMSAGERRDRVAEVLTEVGLEPEIGRRYPHEFSGGQRQRIAVARAMILRPRFVVLDEPTSSLDMTVQAQIVELLLDLQQRHGLTYLFISHDLKVVRALCDEIAVMKDGRIVEQGPAGQLFDAPRESYTRALMNAAL